MLNEPLSTVPFSCLPQTFSINTQCERELLPFIAVAWETLWPVALEMSSSACFALVMGSRLTPRTVVSPEIKTAVRTCVASEDVVNLAYLPHRA